jgi:uncharacterized protein (DUF697 family)
MQAQGLLGLFEKVERLAARLPGPLRKPILHEIRPIKDLFLRARAPRIMLLGQQGEARLDWLDSNSQSSEAAAPQEIRLFDARSADAMPFVKTAFGLDEPDLFLFLQSSPISDASLQQDLDHAARVISETASQASVAGLLALPKSEGAERLRRQLEMELRAKFGKRAVTTLAFSPEEQAMEEAARVITENLPDEAKLQMARVTGAKSVQKHLAQIIVKSASAMSGAIGAQPIPLADFPIITGMQSLMLAGIISISGRQMSKKLVSEFLGAIGANVGAGIIFREGARGLLKFFPGWGNAISGAVAGAGTYAIGRAAIAYFIQGQTLKQVRQTFLEKAARKPPVKDPPRLE